MAQVQQRILSAALLLAASLPGTAAAKKFYPDDPIRREPPPMHTPDAADRETDVYYDFLHMQFGKPGEKAYGAKPIRARNINTLGEVPDSNWYTNRHGARRMSIAELVRGPGNSHAPAEGPLRITGAKTEGVTPGFVIKDSAGRRYQIKFDTKKNFELATGADVMGTKFFHALGYYTPENYLVTFDLKRLVVEPGTKFTDFRGVERDLKQEDVENVLRDIPRDDQGRYRAVASLYLSGKPLDAFRYFGTRTDDPNDTVPHEHRRELRGLKVFASWLQHTDTKALNSLDTLVEENGRKYIRHHLIDFSAAFGTDAFEPKSPRNGYVYLLDWSDAAKSFFTLGLYVPAWARADYKHVKGIGRIEAEKFDPVDWKSHYYNPAFDNCLPEDGFWAAKQIMRFTEPEIRALVDTAQYSDEAGVQYLVKMLVARQQKIGRTYFAQVLPLDEFRVEGGRLRFEDLGVRYGFDKPRQYSIVWNTFDNDAERKAPIAGATGESLPRSDAEYLAADIAAGDPRRAVTVYLRRRGGSYEVVGIER